LIPDGSLAKGEWHDSLRSKAEQYLDAIRAVRIEKTTP
jgi:hypothetical protein